MMKLGKRIGQLWKEGRTGTEAFIEFSDEQIRQAHFEYQRGKFIEDMRLNYPELFKIYSEEDLLKFFDKLSPELKLS